MNTPAYTFRMYSLVRGKTHYLPFTIAPMSIFLIETPSISDTVLSIFRWVLVNCLFCALQRNDLWPLNVPQLKGYVFACCHVEDVISFHAGYPAFSKVLSTQWSCFGRTAQSQSCFLSQQPALVYKTCNVTPSPGEVLSTGLRNKQVFLSTVFLLWLQPEAAQ